MSKKGHASAHWSAAEVSLLRQYSYRSLKTLSRKLPGRSLDAIKKKAARCSYSWSDEYTIPDLAVAIGCCVRSVYRWIGVKPPILVPTRRTVIGEYPSYYLTDEAIATFLRTYPQIWRRFPVPADRWKWANQHAQPGTPEWYALLAPWPCPGQLWLDSFL